MAVESIYLKDTFPVFRSYKYSGYIWSSSKDNENAEGQTNGWVGDQTSTTLFRQAKIGIKYKRVGAYYGKNHFKFNLDGYEAYNWWDDYSSPIAWDGSYADYRVFNSWKRSFTVSFNEIGIMLLPNMKHMITVGYSQENLEHPDIINIEYRHFVLPNKDWLNNYIGLNYVDMTVMKKVFLSYGATFDM